MNMAVAAVASSAHCSSGCESGWTLYLQHSSPSPQPPHHFLQNDGFGFYDGKYHNNSREKIACDADHDSRSYDHDEEEEEEDLSMVSDASSGPPHFHHLDHDHDKEEEVFGNASKRKTQSIIKLGRPSKSCDALDFALDDTASSPIIFPSKKNRGMNDVENQGCSSLESLIDYSSQGFSTTHFQGRSTHFQQPYGFLQSPYSTLQFQQNQW